MLCFPSKFRDLVEFQRKVSAITLAENYWGHRVDSTVGYVKCKVVNKVTTSLTGVSAFRASLFEFMFSVKCFLVMYCHFLHWNYSCMLWHQFDMLLTRRLFKTVFHMCLLSCTQVNLVWKSGPSGARAQLLVVKGRRCEPELVYHLTGHTAAAH